MHSQPFQSLFLCNHIDYFPDICSSIILSQFINNNINNKDIYLSCLLCQPLIPVNKHPLILVRKYLLIPVSYYSSSHQNSRDMCSLQTTPPTIYVPTNDQKRCSYSDLPTSALVLNGCLKFYRYDPSVQPIPI